MTFVSQIWQLQCTLIMLHQFRVVVYHVFDQLFFQKPSQYFPWSWPWNCIHKLHDSHSLIVCNILANIVHYLLFTCFCIRVHHDACRRYLPCFFIRKSANLKHSSNFKFLVFFGCLFHILISLEYYNLSSDVRCHISHLHFLFR